MVLTFVTGNKKKLEEVRAILPDSIGIQSMALDIPEYQGDCDYVSREKCRYASRLVKGPVITEDTSLCFNAYNGLPGPYIKWFMKSIGHSGKLTQYIRD